MGSTVYAESMGLFHKGAGGKGVAPLDVCLTPPPPPTGPLPVPYVNALKSSDLVKGSKSVKIQGETTALENSEVSTSTGNEPATQGGSVVTHKTKGTGYFTLWSFTVSIEGKGVCRHGDLMGQNAACSPPSCVDMSCVVNFSPKLAAAVKARKKCTEPLPKHPGTNEHQNDECRGGPCWQCPAETSGYRGRKSRLKQYKGYQSGERFTPDHQPPRKVVWEQGGCHEPEEFAAWEKSREAVWPHCKKCSRSQGGVMSKAKTAEIRKWV